MIPWLHFIHFCWCKIDKVQANFCSDLQQNLEVNYEKKVWQKLSVLTSSDQFWPVLTSFDQILYHFDQFWPFLTIFDQILYHFWPFLTSLDHFLPVFTSFYQILYRFVLFMTKIFHSLQILQLPIKSHSPATELSALHLSVGNC